MTQYKIKLKFSDDGSDWLFFESESKDLEVLKYLAKKEVERDHNEGLASKLLNGDPEIARATITVEESFKGRKIKGGLVFKTKWR